MKTYIAFWPNKTFSVLSASSLFDLFWQLDEEGDPSAAEVYRLAGRFSVKENCGKRNRMFPPVVEGQRERIVFEDVGEMYSRLRTRTA